MAILGAQKIFLALSLLNPGGGGAAIFSPPPLITAAAVSVVAITAICFEGKRKEAGKILIFPSLIYGEKKRVLPLKENFPRSREKGGKKILQHISPIEGSFLLFRENGGLV